MKKLMENTAVLRIYFYSIQIPGVCDFKELYYSSSSNELLNGTAKDFELDYNELEPHKGVNDIVYTYDPEEGFECDSVNMLGKMSFRLTEKINKQSLYVLEQFEVGGKSIFNFDTPIVYKRVH